MISILFVDDEPNILKGLQRMLRGFSEEWDTEFAGSGADALALMENKRFDVVVSDMRMPNMSGAQLLEEVSQRHPDTIRFVLSGHSDKELILQAVNVAHQYISKPCDAPSLKEKIKSSMEIRSLLDNPVLHKKLSSVHSLPTAPRVYNELRAVLQSEDGTIHAAAKVVSGDVGLTAKILHLVNSSFFALPRHIENLEQAVSLLGLDTIQALTLMTGVFGQDEIKSVGGLTVARLYDHCAAVGGAARGIAQSLSLDQKGVEDSFFAGLLHDVGKLIMMQEFRDELKESLELSRRNGLELHEVEQKQFGVTHALIGAHLLALWGLPHAIIEAVALHHTPSKSPADIPGPLSAVYLANLFVSDESDGQNGPSGRIDMEYLKRIGAHERLENIWCEFVQQGEKEKVS